MQPCEVIVLQVLPSLRSELAKQLVDLGLTQQNVSEALDLTPAAVSQYVSGKRGQEIQFKEEIKENIREKAKEIKTKNHEKSKDIICFACEEIKTTEFFCDLVKNIEKENCEECKYSPLC